MPRKGSHCFKAIHPIWYINDTNYPGSPSGFGGTCVAHHFRIRCCAFCFVRPFMIAIRLSLTFICTRSYWVHGKAMYLSKQAIWSTLFTLWNESLNSDGHQFHKISTQRVCSLNANQYFIDLKWYCFDFVVGCNSISCISRHIHFINDVVRVSMPWTQSVSLVSNAVNNRNNTNYISIIQ